VAHERATRLPLRFSAVGQEVHSSGHSSPASPSPQRTWQRAEGHLRADCVRPLGGRINQLENMHLSPEIVHVAFFMLYRTHIKNKRMQSFDFKEETVS
jgi:hypothetical protein